MNNRARTKLPPLKSPSPQNQKVTAMAASKKTESGKSNTGKLRFVSRERRMALEHQVDKLKKKLREEESVHRALERAFTRPLGTLPRLSPYLPPNTLELLAEVAVLEEEVVRLERHLLSLKHGHHHRISSSNINFKDFYNLLSSNNPQISQLL